MSEDTAEERSFEDAVRAMNMPKEQRVAFSLNMCRGTLYPGWTVAKIRLATMMYWFSNTCQERRKRVAHR